MAYSYNGHVFKPEVRYPLALKVENVSSLAGKRGVDGSRDFGVSCIGDALAVERHADGNYRVRPKVVIQECYAWGTFSQLDGKQIRALAEKGIHTQNYLYLLIGSVGAYVLGNAHDPTKFVITLEMIQSVMVRPDVPDAPSVEDSSGDGFEPYGGD